MTQYTQDQVHRTAEVARYVEQIRKINDNLVIAVQDCRDCGMSWRQIGFALSTSGQAAWEKYGLTPEQRQQRSRQTSPKFTQPSLLEVPDDKLKQPGAR